MTDKLIHSQAAKHSKELLLLLAVPLSIILVIVALLYIPRLFANPTYDFIYCDGYSCDRRFSVNASNRITSTLDSNYRSYTDATLRYYDVDRDASRLLSDDEADKYRVDPLTKSPEGYTLEHNRGGSGFLFWGDYTDSWALKKGMASKPISLGSTTGDKQFIGWVLD